MHSRADAREPTKVWLERSMYSTWLRTRALLLSFCSIRLIVFCTQSCEGTFEALSQSKVLRTIL